MAIKGTHAHSNKKKILVVIAGYVLEQIWFNCSDSGHCHALVLSGNDS